MVVLRVILTVLVPFFVVNLTFQHLSVTLFGSDPAPRPCSGELLFPFYVSFFHQILSTCSLCGICSFVRASPPELLQMASSELKQALK